MANDAGPVAVFAGATAGLGEAILKAYAGKHINARIYFIGRNEVAAEQIITDVRQLWKDAAPKNSDGEGDIIFLKADLSLLRNVRGVAEEFMKREGENARLDFLCMSQGYLTLRGRIGRYLPIIPLKSSNGIDLVIVFPLKESNLKPFPRASESFNFSRRDWIVESAVEGIQSFLHIS
jgi:NAD(P)-dependent dehydrogenase (short-subunit alcohol dehydrogenase family)